MHTVTWLIWLIAALLAITLAPHPFYLCLIFLAAGLVFVACQNASPLARSYRLFLQVGAVVYASYLLFSLITVGGMRGATVLLTLPLLTLPDWLGGLVLGGAITAEALAWGATRGLSIWTLLVVFGTFNALVDHYRLLRLTPRSLFHAGLAVTIAVAFVPSVLRASSEIVEAQRARGHRFGKLHTWLPLIAPLLAGSLEKAVQLAEALDARGYGHTLPNPTPRIATQREQTATLRSWFAVFGSRFGMIAGLLAISGGLFGWLYYGAGLALPIAGALIAAGGLLLGGMLWHLGRQVNRTTYRRERWRQRDSLSVLACLACVSILAALRLSGHHDLVYYPFPVVSLPNFDLRAGLAVVLLAMPGVVYQRAPQAQRRSSQHARRERAALPDHPATPATEERLEGSV